MKLNRLETHDRLLHFGKEQALNIAQGAEDCLNKNRLSLGLQQYSHYIYLFAHPRTHDDGTTKRMIWQPRLTRPKAQTNSYLFRAFSNTDLMEVCWLLPPREQWSQFDEGNVTESETVRWSIEQFTYFRYALEQPFKDDLQEDKCREIYIKVAKEIDEENRCSKMISKPNSKPQNVVESSTS